MERDLPAPAPHGTDATPHHRPSRLRPLAVAAACALALGLTAGCDPHDAVDAAPSGGGPSAGATGSPGRAVSPLANPDGTKPGLAPVASGDLGRARDLIARVTTKGRGPKTGYEREKFGYAWMDSADGVPLAHNGCDTRNDLLKRDGDKVRYRSGSRCVVTSMTLHDPYSGHTLTWTKAKATTVQIDHVMPLSYDWQMGAAQWTKTKREDIANDPLNLLPVDGPANNAKRDSGPASWLPPDRHIRCAYAVRFAQVSLKYHLPVTAPDKEAMRKQCTA